MTLSLLITGAGGYVCSHLAEGLAERGVRVFGFDRHFDPQTRARLEGVELIEVPLSPESFAGIGQRFDFVIHGAALTTPAAELGMTSLAHVQANVAMTIDSLAFARASGAGLVFLSSSGVFSFAEGAVLTEAMVPRGKSDYAVAKQIGERLVSGLEKRSLVLRLGAIYGGAEAVRPSRMRLSPVAAFIREGNACGRLSVTSPRSRRDWTHVRDLAPALLRLLSGGATGLVHLTSARAIDDLALARKIARLAPGWQVVMAGEAGTPVRTPIASNRSELCGFPWLPLETGLMTCLKEAA